MFSLFLQLLHLLYSILIAFTEIGTYLRRRGAKGLNAQRNRLPTHLALALVHNSQTPRTLAEILFVESIERTVSWCRALGIGQLTVYDRQGLALKHSQNIQEKLAPLHSPCDDFTQPEIHYPITPPLSEYSESRSRSPVDGLLHADLAVETILLSATKKALAKPNMHGSRGHTCHDSQPFALHLVSHESSKVAIASTARSFADLQRTKNSRTANLEIDEINAVLEGDHGLSSPDFLIIHPVSSDGAPPELDGFPPWQIRLTEIFCTRRTWAPSFRSYFSPLEPGPIEEEMFREALDEFSGAEMRLGK